MDARQDSTASPFDPSAPDNLEQRLRFRFEKQLPLTLQAETGECGLACLAMIAAYHGNHSGLPALRLQFPQSLKGSSARQLIDIGEELGLQARALRLDLHELAKLKT